MTGAIIRPVILSGGSGTRLWPLSRHAAPKQFHRLTSERTLFQETVLRLAGDTTEARFANPIILANHAHGARIEAELAAIDVIAHAIILEPVARNTAPAIAAAALTAAPEELLVVLPSDHAIADCAAFRRAIISGAPCALDGAIVTFGVRPATPETGYGYIRAGAPINAVAARVGAFVEKPDRPTAERYLAEGGYSWNAGIFLFRAGTMVEEIKRYKPAILEAADAALRHATRDARGILLAAADFARAEDLSIDFAVMERTPRAAVIPIDVGWSDIGSWAALWDMSEKSAEGAASIGEAPIAIDCRNLLTVSDGVAIAAIGVEDLVIVATPDGVLVAKRDRSQDVRKVVEALKALASSRL